MLKLSGLRAAPSCRSCSLPCTTRIGGMRSIAQPVRSTITVRRAATPPQQDVETSSSSMESTSSQDASSSDDDIRKQLSLKRSQQLVAAQSSQNIIQGALEEATLISWPEPAKALWDTALVLAIVSATGTLLFSVNVLMTNAAELWYKH